MTTPPPTAPMPPEQSALLADFARTCKAAARAVSLYPGAHPAIAASLSRLVTSTDRLAKDGPVPVFVTRGMLAIAERLPLRPDSSIGELATLLHERLIGLLTIHAGADNEDWRTFLLLLARAPDDLRAGGGIASLWAQTGRSHFDIREIDYAEVLRERGGADEAEWDRIVQHCLQGDETITPLDERALASLLDALADPTRFAQLMERVQQQTPDADGTTLAARVAALLRLMRAAIEVARKRSEGEAARALQTIAESCAGLTPETMLAILERRRSGPPHEADTVTAVVSQMTDGTMAAFMAKSVTAERGASDRLAQALEALAPSPDRKERIIQLAREEVGDTELGGEDGFEQLWENVSDTVMSCSMMSYSDESFVSREYGRELSATRGQALEVERVSNDPAERVEAWLGTVADAAVQQLDLAMLLDLLRIETTPHWEAVAGIAVGESERRTAAGDAAAATSLVEAIVRETRGSGRIELRQEASGLVERICAGSLPRHVAVQLRSAADADVEWFNRLCQALGPGVVRPLADALTKEEDSRTVRRIGALLLSFGAAGRRVVEQLKNAPHPEVRRTAIALLRSAGGQDALTELASMLGDADPEVQREAVRAIVNIATPNAYSLLHRLIFEADTPREMALRELLSLRDEKAVPMFCFVLSKGEPAGRLVGIHLSMIESLGAMKPRPESVRALQHVLSRGHWWAPFRTAAMRQAAAVALRRLGTADARAVLQSAASTGSRGVRKAARAQVALLTRREGHRP